MVHQWSVRYGYVKAKDKLKIIVDSEAEVVADIELTNIKNAKTEVLCMLI